MRTVGDDALGPLRLTGLELATTRFLMRRLTRSPLGSTGTFGRSWFPGMTVIL